MAPRPTLIALPWVGFGRPAHPAGVAVSALVALVAAPPDPAWPAAISLPSNAPAPHWLHPQASCWPTAPPFPGPAASSPHFPPNPVPYRRQSATCGIAYNTPSPA